MKQVADILLSYQRRWVGDKSRVRVWEKSRRIGASWCEAFMSVMEAAKSREAGGQDTFYLSYNKEMTQTFIRDCAYWAKAFNLLADEADEVVLRDEDRDITVYRIRFASGFNIWGLPSEPRSLRSKQGRVIIDEAAFVDDLPELMKAAFALMMWGGSVSILSTHNGEENPFNELVKDIRAGRKNTACIAQHWMTQSRTAFIGQSANGPFPQGPGRQPPRMNGALASLPTTAMALKKSFSVFRTVRPAHI